VPLALLDSILDSVSDSSWTYGVVFLFAMLDAFFPAIPSETAVITAGVLAASGDLLVGVIILCAGLGAILGDNVSFGIGRTVGEPIAKRLFRGDRKRHLDWAERALDERGPYLIVIGRFIPGGRTAITFSAGLLEMRWRKFIAWDTLAGFVWASYAGMLGYLGGKAFEDEPWKGLVIAFIVAFGIAAGVELYRWRKRRRELARG
jgi:membrane protein DedA with SNARE-associated domain